MWENPQTGHAEAIPRHSEVANLLAKRICRKLSIPDPPVERCRVRGEPGPRYLVVIRRYFAAPGEKQYMRPAPPVATRFGWLHPLLA